MSEVVDRWYLFLLLAVPIGCVSAPHQPNHQRQTAYAIRGECPSYKDIADQCYIATHYDGPLAYGIHYVGEVRDGRPHGWGTLTLSNGTKYVGEFETESTSAPYKNSHLLRTQRSTER